MKSSHYDELLEAFHSIDLDEYVREIKVVDDRVFRLLLNKGSSAAILEVGRFPQSFQDSQWETIFDISSHEEIGERRLQDFYCSPKPKTLCYFRLSAEGGDKGTIRLFDYSTQKFLGPDYPFSVGAPEVRWLSAEISVLLLPTRLANNTSTAVKMFKIDSSGLPILQNQKYIDGLIAESELGETSPEGTESTVLHSKKGTFALKKNGDLIDLHLPQGARIWRSTPGELIVSSETNFLANSSYDAGSLARIKHENYNATSLAIVYKPRDDESQITW